MSALSDWWNTMGLQRKLQFLIQGLLIVILFASQQWISSRFERAVLHSAEERANSITEGTINGLNTLMITKAGDEEVISNAQSRAIFIQKMGTSDKIKELRVIRGKGVNDEFGPGLPEEKVVDDIDRSVLATGQKQFKIDDKDGTTLRAVLPFIAKKDLRGTNCMKCHGVDENAVLGATSIVIDIKDDMDAIKKINAMLWIGQGILQITLFFVIGFIVSRLLRQIGGEPNYATSIASRIASGDLNFEVETRPGDTDSLIAAMKIMRINLAKIVSEVRAGTEMVATASGQIASGNLDLSERTEHQASTLEQTASSMEDLTLTVKQNAENAMKANSLVVSASEVAVKGGSVFSHVVETMSEINTSSKKIVDIIAVIDSIAFQTNILALNAAVEAARAGEQGRGFAVVASEVRNLAQRSASAANEIKALINNSVEKVEVGSKLVDQAGATMHEIVDSIKHVTDIMSEITSASREQTSGIEQINQAISQMDDVTQQNAALVEEAAAAAQSLQDQASNLQEVVGIFKLDAAHVAAANEAINSFEKEHKKIASKLAGKLVAIKPGAVKKLPNKPAVKSAASSDDFEEF